jgi:hypothetical protein
MQPLIYVVYFYEKINIRKEVRYFNLIYLPKILDLIILS